MSRFQTDSLNPSALPSANLGRRIRRLDLDADSGPSSAGPAIASSSFGAAAGGSGSGSVSGVAGGRLAVGERTEAELDRVAEEWNIRIDKEVKSVAAGLRELVELADIGKNPSPPSLTSLHLRLKTSSLVRSTQRLRDLSHELKLALLVSDDIATVARRDAEVRKVRGQVERRRGEVVGAVAGLASGVPAVGGEEQATGGEERDGGGEGDGEGRAAEVKGEEMDIDEDLPDPKEENSTFSAIPNPNTESTLPPKREPEHPSDPTTKTTVNADPAVGTTPPSAAATAAKVEPKSETKKESGGLGLGLMHYDDDDEDDDFEEIGA